MPAHAFASLYLCAALAQPTPRALFHIHETGAVFTSVSVARQPAPSEPTFSLATWLNPPFFVETVASSGAPQWAYVMNRTDNSTLPSFQVTSARHAASSPAAETAIAVVGAGALFDADAACSVFGWAAAQRTPAPAWAWREDDCDATLLYGGTRLVDVSDDGSVAAFSGLLFPSRPASPALFVLNAQTGRLRFNDTLPPGANGGSLSITSGGGYVMWSTSFGLYIYDAATGAQRANIKHWGGAALTDSGSFVATCDMDAAPIWAWDGAAYVNNATFNLREFVCGPNLPCVCAPVTPPPPPPHLLTHPHSRRGHMVLRGCGGEHRPQRGGGGGLHLGVPRRAYGARVRLLTRDRGSPY